MELGGTKTSFAVGKSPDDLTEARTIATGEPDDTLHEVIEFFSARSPSAVGVASFGPLDFDRGRIGATPKPGWSGTQLVALFVDELGVPLGLDTDVNGAALGEGRWGAGQGLRNFVYVTVGTGIGGGALVDGKPLHGLGHPEMGHMVVIRHPEDRLPGVCSFHGDCLEGLASGPAIQAREGIPSSRLEGAKLAGAVAMESFYLGQMMCNLVYTVAPQRVVLGGGVASLPGLADRVNQELVDRLGGYPGILNHGAGFVVPPGLGSLSGLAGGLVLAERAAEPTSP